MKPLITKSQGRACRKAAEYIADGKWDGASVAELNISEGVYSAYSSIGGIANVGCYNQHEVYAALLWCAEIAGEA